MSILKNAVALLGLSIVMTATAVQATEVNVLTDRTDFHLKPILKQFESQTGIKVNAVYVEGGAIPARMSANPKEADLIVTLDSAVLAMAKDRGWTQPIVGSKSIKDVRPQLRDKENDFVGLSYRARTIVYSTDRVDPNNLRGYEDLSDPKYKGRVCMRPLTHAYNIAMVSEMIADRGEAWTRDWVKGVTANLAVKPSGNDRKQGELVAEGVCDISLMNTYYYGLMLSNNKQRQAAAKIQLFFPDQAGKGAYVLSSGAAVVKGTKNSKQAVQLIDFMLSPIGQNFVSNVIFEYPAIDQEALPIVVQGFGEGQPGIDKGRAKFNFISADDRAKNRNLAVEILTAAIK
jgi:iron(III) transport system substrate-binding protein